jgi:acetylornithine deacetylase/succinyl-diaminopimelate desuccinylase-like protein
VSIETNLSVKYLQDLIRIDTTNPPGNELPAAQYLAEVLRQGGLEPTVLESAPGRGSVVARLRGDGSQRPLLLMSHIDVVPAEAREWTHPPFAAEIADGYLWGRGAVDTKNLTAIELATLLTLKHAGASLKRDLIFAATADEEVGGQYGMAWLVNTHPELVDAEYAINEGGGFGLEVGGKRFYLVQTGEKGVCWMKFTVKGTPGHGSIPHDDNAVTKLADALTRASRARLPQHRTATVDRLVRALAGAQPFPASVMLPLVLNPTFEPLILKQMAKAGAVGMVLRATLHNTVSPTMLKAGSKTNVIPSEATAEVDGRTMPGFKPEDLVRELRPYIGDEVQVDITTSSDGYESEPASPLFDLFQQVLSEHDAGSVAVPFLVPGGTDGRFLADKGVKVYGFSPLRQEPGLNVLELAHARNERISLANLEFATQVVYDVVRKLCGGA